jgi:hypothetical protein
MRDYRVHAIASDGHIEDRIEFFCDDDATAKERAKRYADSHDVELWHWNHRIAKFESEQ